jgi:hypothetical protein
MSMPARSDGGGGVIWGLVATNDHTLSGAFGEQQGQVGVRAATNTPVSPG